MADVHWPTPADRRRVRGRVLAFLGRHRTVVQISIDAVAWSFGLLVALCVRYDFANGPQRLAELIQFLPLVLMCQVWVGLVAGLYQGRWRFGSFEEVAAVTTSAALSTLLLAAVNVWYLDRWVPASVPFGAGLVGVVGMLGARYLWRLEIERHRRPRLGDAEPLVVIGAGDGAAQLIASILRDPNSGYIPVALLDDDPAKASLRLSGVPVLGTRDDLVRVARAVGANTVLLAIPSASAALVRDVSAVATAAGLTLRVLPAVKELLGGAVAATDIRPVSPADLLGRREIKTDLSSIAGYVTGRRILVTGAGGSIGSELCRQVARFAPEVIVLLDRDESALHAVQLSLDGRALLDTPNLVVADVRDRARVHDVVASWRPHVVFHAAALKHLPLLELHPDEAIKTNVWGTQHLLDACVVNGVERFVNISTDKAANPISALGFTKRIGERLTARAGELAPEGVYLSVRFGNVLGTRGSMLGAFQAQIAAGGPVTVTDPRVERFFMTVEEAVQLVVQAGAIGATGEVLVLDMGHPVRITDVASLLIDQASRDVSIVYTGLRPGEKLSEDLWGAGEEDRRVTHPLISHVAVPPLDPAAVGAGGAFNWVPTRDELAAICATASPIHQ